MNNHKCLCLLLAVAALLPGGHGVGRADPSTHQHAQQATAELPAGPFTSASLYQVGSVWTTATGQRFRLEMLQGKVQVLVMAYTTCEYACPLLVSVVKNLELALPPELASQVGFVFVTFDPVRDTLPALLAYSRKMQLETPPWTVLHGQPDDVVELAMLLGVKYRQEPTGGFAHSNLLTVLNKKGEIVHRQQGLHDRLADTLAAIRRAAQE